MVSMQQQQGIGSTNGQLQTTGKSANFLMAQTISAYSVSVD